MSNLNLTEEARFQRQKMNYFFAFTGNNNNDIATNFLIMANWDEKKAVEIYFAQQNNKNNPPQNSNDFKRGNIPSQNINIQNPYQNPPSQSGYNSYVPPHRNNNVYNGQSQNPYIPSNNHNSNQFQQPFHQDEDSNNINEFHINDEILQNNDSFTQQELFKFKSLILFINNRFQFVAKSLEHFMKFLKEHAGIIIILNTNKMEEVKSHFSQIIKDPLCKDIVNNSIIYPIMTDSILGRKFISQFSCISFPSYFFCKYKDQKDITITGRMEAFFNTNLFMQYLLSSFPESQNELRESLRRSFNENIMNDINNNNEREEANNRNQNKDNFIENYNNFFLGNSVELNQLIESLGQSSINNQNRNQNNNNLVNSNNLINSNNINNSIPNNNNMLNNNSIQSNDIIQSNNPFQNNDSINIKDSIYGLSDGQIIAKREQEMKELERQQEEKIRKENEEKQKILEEENRIKKRDEDYEKQAEYSKQLIPPEPEEDNPNATKIIIKYPDGVKSIERRFLKSEKIEVLYILVKSKGREIFLEQESSDFYLTFGFPPKNLEDSKNKTLESEGLFPNAMIQIREK